MKGWVGLAVILGIAGTALGVIALVMDMDQKTYDEKTLNLKGGKEVRVNFRADAVKRGHPVGTLAWESNTKVSGDASGEFVRTCAPVVTNDVACEGAFQLTDGDIEFQTGEEGGPKTKTTADGAIVGGTRAYEGAIGSFTINFKDDTYRLHLLIPKK
jgi:hypothetical protein